MKCDDTQQVLTPYLLGDLDGETAARVREHLASCEGCRAAAQEIQPTLDLLRDALACPSDAPQRLSPAHRDRVVRIASAPAGEKPRSGVVTWVATPHPRLAYAASLVLVLGLLWAMLMPAAMKSKKTVQAVGYSVLPDSAARRGFRFGEQHDALLEISDAEPVEELAKSLDELALSDRSAGSGKFDPSGETKNATRLHASPYSGRGGGGGTRPAERFGTIDGRGAGNGIAGERETAKFESYGVFGDSGLPVRGGTAGKLTGQKAAAVSADGLEYDYAGKGDKEKAQQSAEEHRELVELKLELPRAAFVGTPVQLGTLTVNGSAAAPQLRPGVPGDERVAKPKHSLTAPAVAGTRTDTYAGADDKDADGMTVEWGFDDRKQVSRRPAPSTEAPPLVDFYFEDSAARPPAAPPAIPDPSKPKPSKDLMSLPGAVSASGPVPVETGEPRQPSAAKPGSSDDFAAAAAEFDSVSIVKSPVIMRGIMGAREPGRRGRERGSIEGLETKKLKEDSGGTQNRPQDAVDGERRNRRAETFNATHGADGGSVSAWHDQEAKRETVPLLGDLPMLGSHFKLNSETARASEQPLSDSDPQDGWHRRAGGDEDESAPVAGEPVVFGKGRSSSSGRMKGLPVNALKQTPDSAEAPAALDALKDYRASARRRDEVASSELELRSVDMRTDLRKAWNPRGEVANETGTTALPGGSDSPAGGPQGRVPGDETRGGTSGLSLEAGGTLGYAVASAGGATTFANGGGVEIVESGEGGKDFVIVGDSLRSLEGDDKHAALALQNGDGTVVARYRKSSLGSGTPGAPVVAQPVAPVVTVSDGDVIDREAGLGVGGVALSVSAADTDDDGLSDLAEGQTALKHRLNGAKQAQERNYEIEESVVLSETEALGRDNRTAGLRKASEAAAVDGPLSSLLGLKLQDKEEELSGETAARVARDPAPEPAPEPPKEPLDESLEEDREEAGPERDEAGPRFKAFGVNPFVVAAEQAFSTFAIDVDTASYTLGRNYMLRGNLPPAESVRTEEFVNFFDYQLKPPAHGTFRVYTECAPSKFGRGLHLLKIGVKGQRLGREEQRPAVLTFLIDTSGSMDQPDRLGLVRKSLAMLVEQLSPRDRVAIVQYDSHARLVLEHTSAAEKEKILAAIDGLQCGGSTNLEEGMARAYQVAAQAFGGGAENRVLIISDGVANLGSVAAEDILGSVEKYRDQGITCSVFGYGIGTYDDVMLETLANKGDGIYAFIDSEDEARRVFVDDLAATLNTIATDVKIQVEFNPRYTQRYRQLGYENRQLKKEQFRDDTVDAGEVGSGQSVTALYELALASTGRSATEPIATVRVRYRRRDNGKVEELEHPVRAADLQATFEQSSPRFRLATGVAEFAEILRGSPFAAGSQFEDVASVLRPVALDLNLDRRVQELLRLVQGAGSMSRGSL